MGDLERLNMKWVWAGVAGVVAIFGYGLTSLEDLPEFIERREEYVAFFAGYTLPLVAASAVVTMVYLSGWADSPDREWWHHWALIGGTLWSAAALSSLLGLGLSPFDVAFGGVPAIPGGPPPLLIARVTLLAVAAYLTAYGWNLSIAAMAIGVALGLQGWKKFGD